MTEIVRVQALARGFLQRRLVPVNANYLFPCKSATVDDVPVHKAVKHFVYDLVTRRAGMYGVKLNAPTVLRMLKHHRLKFASYARHKDESTDVAFARSSYVWLRQESTEGSVPVEFPAAKRRRLSQSGTKRACLSTQPKFLTHDVLSTVAKFLPVESWGRLACLCHGSGFCLPRNHLRRQMRQRLGYSPRDPFKALMIYSAGRSQTPWQHKKEVVFAFDAKWATNAHHSHDDRIVHLWSNGSGDDTQLQFVTREGLCGLYKDVNNSIVSMKRMAPTTVSFFVTLVSVGIDGSVAMVHNRGMSVYSNAIGNKYTHVMYPSSTTTELACVDENNVFFIHGIRYSRISRVCFRCAAGAHTSVFDASALTTRVSMLKTAKTGAIWRGGHLRLCRVGRHGRNAHEVQPRLSGRGRIVYISDMLPSGNNAVLQAVGPDMTRIAFTDGRDWIRMIELQHKTPVMMPVFGSFSTVGDMICYRERVTHKHVAVRLETDQKLKPVLLAFAQHAKQSTRQMHFINGAIFVIEDGTRIVKYSVE